MGNVKLTQKTEDQRKKKEEWTMNNEEKHTEKTRMK